MHRTVLAVAAGVLATAAATIPAAAATIPAATSPATLTGVVRADQPSASNSATAKSVTVRCPGSKVVINAAGFIGGGDGKVVLDSLFPSEDLTQVTVSGKETDNYTPNWTVDAVATCADRPAGVEWNVASSLDNSDSPKSASVYCSSGKTVLGTGMDVIGGDGEVDAYSIVPAIDAAGRAFGATVTGGEHDPLATSWHVNALIICADALPGQQVLYADTAPSTLGNAGIALYCPFGTVATGTGYAILNALTSTTATDGIEEAVINTVEPGGSTTTPTDRNAPYAYEEDGTNLIWTLRAYLLCADS